MNGFNIIIKDNFLDKNVFQEVRKTIDKHMYAPKDNILRDKKHLWFSCNADDKIQEIIKNKCEQTWNKKFKVYWCSYTMLSAVEPVVHCDLNENCDHQVIVYIKGNTNLHKGTGFYLDNELNTHVGFNENRAVLWHANTYHSPLNWASDDKSLRYSIIMQMKEV